MDDMRTMTVEEINLWCLSGPRHDSEQVRRAAAMCELARRLAAAEAERDALVEALTPSGDTKAAYIGEFKFETTEADYSEDECGDMCRTDIQVERIIPWAAIKEIMAAIRARAEAARTEGRA